LLNLKILALTLIPIFSAGAPKDGVGIMAPLELVGVHGKISEEFLVGSWRHTHDFFRWGATDRRRAQIKRFPGYALMRLEADGDIEMYNLFKPSKGKWKLTDKGLMIHDPAFPERGSHTLPIRKKSKDRIWVMLPFTEGASGVGLTRVSEKRARWIIGRAQRDRDKTYYVPPKKDKKKKKKRKTVKQKANPLFEQLKKEEIYTEEEIMGRGK
jgi:hypothetical protein